MKKPEFSNEGKAIAVFLTLNELNDLIRDLPTKGKGHTVTALSKLKYAQFIENKYAQAVK